MNSNPDVVVIGAGITGLACAHRLKTLGFDTLVLESSDRVGGVIRSERVEGYLIERGPNSLLPTAPSFELMTELGLTTDLIQANPKSPRYIVVNGQLKAIPFGPLTFRGITRAIAEPFIRSKSVNDESISGFFTRRFGAEVHDRLVAPFVTGVYAGDTEKLSVGASFPRVTEMEARFGSVTVGMFRGRSKVAKTHPTSISTFTQGMETLPHRLAEGLNVRLNSSGVRIGKDIQTRATVIAVPAHKAGEIVEGANPDLAGLLATIEHAPIIVAATSLPEDSLPAPLRGFGFLVPRAERMNILGTVFNSLLFSGRAPKGRLLLTSFVGGALKPEAFDWPDERVWDVVCSELKHVMKSTLQPEPVALFRHRRAIPQYTIGHLKRIQNLTTELRRSPGLFVAGNFLNGVSVPACMEIGEKTAHQVADFLRTRS